MAEFQTRAQLLGTLAGAEMERNTGRQLRRLQRRGFALFRGGGGTGTGIVLIIAGILALAFILYSIWLRKKKQAQQQAGGPNQQQQMEQQQMQQQQMQQQQQQQVVHQPAAQPDMGKPYYPYQGGPAPGAVGAPGYGVAPTV